MTTLREAAQQALEAYDQHEPLAVVMGDLRFALCAALAEPVEPVAWYHIPHPGNGMRPLVSLSEQREPSMYAASVPLYLKEQL